MNLNAWLEKNRTKFGSDFEIMFATNVLPLVAALRLDSITVQYPFQDLDKKQRYCDFVIRENDDVRIAIEIDGYDKRGTGMGMSHSEFVDWQRRQSALTAQGWYVLRFANRDVRDSPKRCAEHISLLLKHSRSSSLHKGLDAVEKERLDLLSKAQNITIDHLSKETSVMKYTVTLFTVLIFALVMVIVWQNGAFSHQQIAATTHNVSSVLQSPLPGDTNSTNMLQPTSSNAMCDRPVDWQHAGRHIGQMAAVVGPLMKVTSRENVRGNPLWIDVGGVFPDRQRLALVVWGENRSHFPMLRPGYLEGRTVCVIGQIESYKGAPQIELKTSNQFVVLPLAKGS